VTTQTSWKRVLAAAQASFEYEDHVNNEAYDFWRHTDLYRARLETGQAVTRDDLEHCARSLMEIGWIEEEE
jgi:hypothetical protein